MSAAGNTESDEPSTRNRSQARVSSCARFMGNAGICCPKEIVADLMIPPQALHGPTVPVARNSVSMTPSSMRTSQERHFAYVAVPMQLDHLVLGNPRILMQVVHVLSDHTGRLAGRNEVCHRIVSKIRFRSDPAVSVVETSAPGLASLCFRSNELLKVNGLHAAPDSAGAAKVGDARFSADAGAGKDDHTARRIHETAEL